jgi:hypothetical protein
MKQNLNITVSDTQIIWGVNFGQNNLTAAFLEASAIANALTSAAFQDAKITLEAIEIGNEADLYTSNGARDSWFNVQQYVTQYVYTVHSGPPVNTMLAGNLRVICRWTTFVGNVTAAANRILGTNVSLQGGAFSGSSHSTSGFSPQAIFKNGILSSPAGSQIKLCVIRLPQFQAKRFTLAVLRPDNYFS